MAKDTVRVELNAPLAGKHVVLDPDELTFGLIEDLQSGQAAAMLDGLAAAIVGGDLPKGTDRVGLRRLTPEQAKALVEGVTGAFSLSKS
jgi:hypothetical protein